MSFATTYPPGTGTPACGASYGAHHAAAGHRWKIGDVLVVRYRRLLPSRHGKYSRTRRYSRVEVVVDRGRLAPDQLDLCAEDFAYLAGSVDPGHIRVSVTRTGHRDLFHRKKGRRR